MPAKRNNPTIPSWTHDQLDSSSPPEVEPAYFDSVLKAWVLSKHADILAAFRASSLAPTGPHDKNDTLRSRIRTETIEALSPAHLRAWREKITPEVRLLAGTLPTAEPVDLMDEYVSMKKPNAFLPLPLNPTTPLCAPAQRPRTLSCGVAFTPAPKPCATPGSLLSPKPYLVYWEMPGSPSCNIRSSGPCCTNNLH
jgi:hypothetical protein